MTGMELCEKYEKVKHILRPLGRVAVAFSGGVDSSLLLFAALEVLGDENVYALHGRSTLNLTDEGIEEFHRRNYPTHEKLVVLDLNPLSWPDFIENRGRKCYLCKNKTYTLFEEVAQREGVGALADGTNFDDLSEDRPGLQVIREKGVLTPLADAGMTKKDIRFMARCCGLSNHDSPSNSCCATRLFEGGAITAENLSRVRTLEKYLAEQGFTGCRVKLDGKRAVVQLRQQDFAGFCRRHNRLAFMEVCRSAGYDTVMVDIRGRD